MLVKTKKNSTIKTIPFGQVHSIVRGIRTSTLRRRKDKKGYPSSDGICFSIVSKRRTLDLQCVDSDDAGEELRDRWVRCLNLALMKFRRVNKPAEFKQQLQAHF
eukprot:TRINITY_DN11398_c0_g1_i1.p1 TRINITY_DN11398_c0_g1~~TRINITY_DN11398_c0_g1_i1.p1  ORF type:complete len:104 (+),score=13.44 TRINITY_DN11398_c0_g1_i1:109-420(+)